MKKSQAYYLKKLSNIVEDIRLGNEFHVCDLPRSFAKNMLSVFDMYIFHKWLDIGDTAFNRLGYRNATDYLFEQLKNNS